MNAHPQLLIAASAAYAWSYFQLVLSVFFRQFLLGLLWRGSMEVVCDVIVVICISITLCKPEMQGLADSNLCWRWGIILSGCRSKKLFPLLIDTRASFDTPSPEGFVNDSAYLWKCRMWERKRVFKVLPSPGSIRLRQLLINS